MFSKALPFAPLLATFVSAATWTVGVGKDETTGQKGVGFDPSVIHPQPGDTIVFEFRSGSHSVVQSTFDQPCTPLDSGFNSGVQTVSDSLEVDADGLPTVSLAVNDTQPLWFYDQAANTCNQAGVLAANPSADQTDAEFKAAASTAIVAPTATSTSSSESETGSGSASGSAPAQTESDNAAAGLVTSVPFGQVVAILGGLMAGAMLL